MVSLSVHSYCNEQECLSLDTASGRGWEAPTDQLQMGGCRHIGKKAGRKSPKFARQGQPYRRSKVFSKLTENFSPVKTLPPGKPGEPRDFGRVPRENRAS